MAKHRKTKSNDNNDENDNSELENNFQRKPNNSIVWPIFIIGFIVIILSLSSAVFPGMLISITGNDEFLEPFEMSSIGIPIIIINIISISLIILYNRQSLPKSFVNCIKNIFSFELSNKNS